MELHQIISAKDPEALLEKQDAFLAAHPDFTLSFRRYFLSCREQKGRLLSCSGWKDGGAVSFVIQPLLGGDTLAVWLYLVKDCPVELLWHTNLCSRSAGTQAQTTDILLAYEADLARSGLTIGKDCVRTWFYVDDIDNNYAGVVVGRRENFRQQGMTESTHYLASTGICGGAVESGTSVQMDALAIRGDFSQHYLYAPANFNPTHQYGVTFERGVVVEYGGQSHALISGTASIDNKGQIVHPGDVCAQTGRMLENVGALLDEAGCLWSNVQMMVVYLRNAADHASVSSIFEQRFARTGIPYIITLAPVCRPGWLIEMECIAVWP